MSLVLPYPDLVFVPLDPLTAEEQNQIVANYEFISDQFPLSSDKIDFTTIDYTSTPKVVYKINGKPVYRVYVSGTTSSGDDTSITISTGDEVRLCGHQIYVQSFYGQIWSVPNYFVSAEGYRNSIYQSLDATSSLKINMPMGSYLRSQPYHGYLDYYYV